MQEEVYGGRDRGVLNDDLSESKPDSLNDDINLRLNYIDQLLEAISDDIEQSDFVVGSDEQYVQLKQKLKGKIIDGEAQKDAVMELQDLVLFDPRDLQSGSEVSSSEEGGVTSSSSDSDERSGEELSHSSGNNQSKRAKFSKKSNLEQVRKDKNAKSVSFSPVVGVMASRPKFSKKPKTEQLKDRDKRKEQSVPSYVEHIQSQQDKGQGDKSGHGFG